MDGAANSTLLDIKVGLKETKFDSICLRTRECIPPDVAHFYFEVNIVAQAKNRCVSRVTIPSRFLLLVLTQLTDVSLSGIPRCRYLRTDGPGGMQGRGAIMETMEASSSRPDPDCRRTRLPKITVAVT
jgi:hypothetical protein